MFKDALRWKRGEEFVCVVFRNRVPYAIGATMHTAVDVPVGGICKHRKRVHRDIDLRYVRSQDSCWILVDEMWQIADQLF